MAKLVVFVALLVCVLAAKRTANKEDLQPKIPSFEDGFLRCDFLLNGVTYDRKVNGSVVQPEQQCVLCRYVVGTMKEKLAQVVDPNKLTREDYMSAMRTVVDQFCEMSAPKHAFCCNMAKEIVDGSRATIFQGLAKGTSADDICFNSKYCKTTVAMDQAKTAVAANDAIIAQQKKVEQVQNTQSQDVTATKPV